MQKRRVTYIFLIFSLIVHFFCVNSHARGKSTAPIVQSRLISMFPHDNNAFTQGFLFHNGFFYESTGKYGHSSLRKIEPETGLIHTHYKINKKFFTEGICIWKNNIYQLTWKSGKCFVYKIDSLARSMVFKYKGQGWGLATDGQFIFQSDGSSKLTFRDPYDFARIKKVQVTDGLSKVYRLNELEYINGFIFSNIWMKDRIAVIDPNTGLVKLWIDISNLRPLAGNEAEAANGIAWDSQKKRLFVTGKLWDKVFEIKLPDLLGKKAK